MSLPLFLTLETIGIATVAAIWIADGRKKARDEDSFETPFGDIANVPNRHGAVR